MLLSTRFNFCTNASDILAIYALLLQAIVVQELEDMLMLYDTSSASLKRSRQPDDRQADHYLLLL